MDDLGDLDGNEPRYRVGEFARLCGVSVRTLHHYDRLGLLRPTARSRSGHRLYADSDLLRLQQVLTLRYLGIGLASIGELLDRDDFDLLASLSIQREVLRERRGEMDRMEGALDELLRTRLATGRWDWRLAARASATVQDHLRGKEDQMEERFSPREVRRHWQELERETGSEQVEELQRAWATLLAEVRARQDDLDPAGPEAQDLAARWNDLVARTFRGDTFLMGAVGQGYREGRFADIEGAPKPEDFDFIRRAAEAGGSSSPQ